MTEGATQPLTPLTPGGLLLAARRYEGERESPSNWSPENKVVRKSLASVYLDSPHPWCAGFVCLSILEAIHGVLTERRIREVLAAKTAYPPGFRASARAMGLWDLNKGLQVAKTQRLLTGDIAIYDHGKAGGHTDIIETVTTVEGAPYVAFTTIGGNTNKGGSRQGIGVFSGILRGTNDQQLVGVIRLPWAAETRAV